MEYLRSCYSSRWFLYRDNPSLFVRGRYYFAADGTPCYPGFHNLGSKTWDDKNFPVDAVLGEDRTAVGEWYSGAAPAALPGVDTVGNPECIQDGDTIADRTSDVISGLPRQCFTNIPQPVDFLNTLTAFDSCSLQAFYIAAVIAVYHHDANSLEQGFTLLLGGGFVGTFHLGTQILPSIYTVQTPTCTVVLADGTVNFQQAALQAFTGISGTVDYGGFSTSVAWYNSATWMIQCLEQDGVDPNVPIVFVGHSYGGATATVAAARWKLADPTRQVYRFGFASPKPGDIRLQQILQTIGGIALQNDGDLVPVCPANYATTLPVALFLGHPELLLWGNWYPPPTRFLLSANGALTPNQDPLLDYTTLLGLAQQILGLQPLAPIQPHRSGEYLRRTLLRCPNPEWPVTQPVLDWINNVPPLANVEIFTTPGNGYWIAPAGATTITVEVWGAGAIAPTANPLLPVEGGGGGAYARKSLTVIPGNTYLFWIGFGSLGVPLSNGLTWFGSSNTVRADCGGHRSLSLNTQPGMASGCIGDIAFDGGWGQGDVGTQRGGGGSSAGRGAPGNPTTPIFAGTGGIAPPGGGNGGDGAPNVGVDSPGQPGQQPGGGGGGGTQPFPAAPGGDGMIRIRW